MSFNMSNTFVLFPGIWPESIVVLLSCIERSTDSFDGTSVLLSLAAVEGGVVVIFSTVFR